MRSEEHTSELQSPVPNSYAVFFLKKKKQYSKLVRLRCIHQAEMNNKKGVKVGRNELKVMTANSHGATLVTHM